MKKSIKCLAVLTIAMSILAGCGQTPDNVSVDENVPASEEAGVANPMVEISSDDEFLNQLGFSIDTSCFGAESLERFIINQEMAHVAFTVDNPEGNPVKCVFRGTKNDELAKNPTELIGGIYASDFSENSEIIVPTDKGDISFNTVYSPSSKTTLSYFDCMDVHYTLSFEGDLSQMRISEINDSAFKAIGAGALETEESETSTGKVILPLLETIDINNIDDAMFSASIDNIATLDGVTTADVTLYVMELFDVVDITTMVPGDTIVVNGEEIVVNDIKDGNPVDFNDENGPRNVILVNGGLEEGGTELIGYEGGTYRFFGFDDHASYSEIGTVNIEITQDAVINDSSDLENPEGVVLATSELESLKDKEFDPGFNLLNTRIRIVDNQIVEINRIFIP